MEVTDQTMLELILLKIFKTSGQDRSIGEPGLPSHLTTSKLQLYYRTTTTQSCQKST